MSYSRVRETSITTGAGNVTVDGAVADHVTLNSTIGVNRRFPYYIVADGAGVWESGVGYMSASTTLVRESVTQNSAGTYVPLSLPAGTKTVTIDVNGQAIVQPSIGYSSLIAGNEWHRPANFIRPNSTLAMVADRGYYMPLQVSRPLLVDRLGIGITTGSGTAANKIHLAIYDVNPSTGGAGFRLRSTTDLDPSVAVFVSGTFSEIQLSAGVYWGFIWSDVTPVVRANDGTIFMNSATSSAASNAMTATKYEYSSNPGITDAPATGTATNANTGGTCPIMLLGHT